MYDIAIIGLGPAGANFARMIDTKKFSVAAIDRKTPDKKGGFSKPCGGLLAPDAQKALARLNLPLPGEVLVSPQIFYVRTIDTDRKLQRSYQRFYINIDRDKFDRWLISLIPKSVDVYYGTAVTGIKRSESCFEITIRSKDGTDTIKARNIVGADGANSVVAKSLHESRKSNLLLSVQEWYENGSGVPFFSCVFDGKNKGRYSWSLYKGSSFIFGGAYEPKGAKQAFERQKQMIKSFGIEPGVPVKREACFLYRLKTPFDFRLGEKGVYMIGEAAGFISPSSFEGISGALNSSRILSRIFNENENRIGRRYKRAAVKLRAKYSLKVIKAGILGSGFLRGLIMRSGIESMKVEE